VQTSAVFANPGLAAHRRVKLLTNGLAIVRLCSSWGQRLLMLLWLIRYSVLRLLPRSGHRSAISTARYNGLRMTLDWHASEHIPLREVLVRGEYWPTAEWFPLPGDTVVDVGANAGVFTLAVARLVGSEGRVIAIEPNPVVLGRLTANVKANGFEDRVTILPIAIADHTARGLVVDQNGNSTVARIHVLTGSESISSETVGVRTLDDALGDLGIAHVDLLKVDVEGLERSVMEGSERTLAHCNRMVMEIGDMADVPAIQSLCVKAGLAGVTSRPAGPDSGATLLFARRADLSRPE
jgi:FkbM family methyltransferase